MLQTLLEEENEAMSTTYRPYHPGQQLLLPVDLREWLPEGDLAYFLSDVVDVLDLSAFYAPYQGDGRRNQPYHPAMMLKVLLYAYATGVYSSRKIAVRLERDVAFRVLLGNGEVPQPAGYTHLPLDFYLSGRNSL